MILGAALAIVFGVLWIRDTARTHAPVDSSAAHALVDEEPSAARAAAEEQHLETYGRAGFITLATIGVGGVIGAAVTLPSLGFAVLPVFTGEAVESPDVDLGPISNFPEGTFTITTFTSNPAQGQVSRRTAYIRNNGLTKEKQPSFTIIYSRCVHLGCPVQPNGPRFEDKAVKFGTCRSRPCSRPASAAPATAAPTTRKATAPPARPCARSTASRSRSRTVT